MFLFVIGVNLPGKRLCKSARHGEYEDCEYSRPSSTRSILLLGRQDAEHSLVHGAEPYHGSEVES